MVSIYIIKWHQAMLLGYICHLLPFKGTASYKLISSNSGSATYSYTFTNDYKSILLFVTGGVAATYTYNGSGELVFSANNSSADPLIKTRVYKNVKSGDTISGIHYGYQIISIE